MMPPVERLLFSAIVSVTAFSLWKVLWFLVRHLWTSPLRHLRGPKRRSLIFGNLEDLTNDYNIERWVEEYGNTLRYQGVLNRNHLITVDTRAVNYILTHPDDFQKPPDIRHTLDHIFGEGLLTAEGTQHRRQRRIMIPAFGQAHIRALTETFLAKADRLRDLWLSEVSRDPTARITGTRIDIVPWLNRLTLDIMGLTGFNYNFEALESGGEPNELGEAFAAMFKGSLWDNVFDAIQWLVPVLRLIPSTKTRRMRTGLRTMRRIGKELLADAKKNALAGAIENGEIEKSSLRGRDLLSLLVKANMATDIPESQRLSDKAVIAQVPTFLVAGHESSSITVTWALYAMTQAPEVQRKLRDELLSVDTDTPSMDELTALPYLDAVIRETLRMYSPVPASLRIAMKDDELPVAKPYTDKYGISRNTITIAKGDQITLPIQAMNRIKELWGPDAHEFKPERWNNIPEAVSQVPGVWAHLLTFSGGPRACIGFRFLLAETKAVLFSLVRAFEFELAVPTEEVIARTSVLKRPVLRSDDPRKAQLPLLVHPYRKM